MAATRKIDPHTPRVLTPEETVARIWARRRAVPITRLADLTPLARDGAPVWCAVTPMARDLTTHLGKGMTAPAARASALMEAVERISAETSPHPIRRERAEDLPGAVDPTHFELPADTSWTPERVIDWLPGECLLSGAPVWMPADLVLSPPREGVIRQPDTNGLASGNTWEEAVVHGLCEVIERDAAGQRLFCDLFAAPERGPDLRRLDPATLPAAALLLYQQITATGRRVFLDNLTDDIEVAVLRAHLVDDAYPGQDGPEQRVFVGYGCDASAQTAVTRALTEAAQSRLAVLQGARDSFNDTAQPNRAAARAALHAPLEPGAFVSFFTLPDLQSTDLHEDLDFVLAAVRRAGLNAVHVSDLTRSDLGMPVVRVRIPDLTSFLVDRSRYGPRCLRWMI